MNRRFENAREMFKKSRYQGEGKRLDNKTPEAKAGPTQNILRSQPNNPVDPAAIGYVINDKVIIVVAYLPSKRDS